MKAEKSQAQGSSSELTLLYVMILLFLVAKFYHPILRAYFLISHFWSTDGHEVVICLLALLFSLLFGCGAVLWNRCQRRRSESAVTEEGNNSYLLGHEIGTKKPVHLQEPFLATHCDLIAGTGEGKTVLLAALQAQAIARGRGMIIIDGKADRSYRDQLYANVVKAGRKNDFMMFSLSNPHVSSTFNPFCDGSPELIAERIFGAMGLDGNSYYESIQFAALRSVIALLIRRGERPMPGVIRELLRDQSKLKGWLTGLNDPALIGDIEAMLKQKAEDFQTNYSGLVTALGHFSDGVTAKLYNTPSPEIQILDAIRRNKIVYFQLPTLQYPFLGAATGKLVLQCIQSAVSEIQEAGLAPKDLYMIYLDDFNDYLYPKFSSLLNKARSANVGVIFSHQSIGDLEKVSAEFAEIVMSNTKFKVIMRVNDPETAEKFSKIIGTQTTEKSTSRRSWGFFGSQDTGDESVRETEEYIVHPNVFKQGLQRGQGVIILPYPHGRIIKKVEFKAPEWVSPISLPVHDLPEIDLVRASTFRGRENPEQKEVPTDKGESQAPQNKDDKNQT